MKFDSTAIAIALLIAVIALYLGAVGPLTDSLNRTKAELAQEENNLNTTRLSITQAPDVKSRLTALAATNAANRAKLLVPLLNSHAMRAKSMLADMAFECGLENVEYEEGGYRALPVPKDQLPKNRTGRRAIRVKAAADYAAAVSFLMRAEKELPLMTVQAFSVKTSPRNHDQQDVEMVLEWPCEGEVIK